MKRALAAAAAVAAVGLAGLAWAAWTAISAPLYTPGQLEARADLEPTATPWQVTDEVTLAGSAVGSGPVVLFVHGGPGAPPDALAPALAALATDYRVVTWDQRGSGRSSNPWPGPSGQGDFADVQALEASLGIGEQLADIERLRRQLGGGPLLLVGHSYGALLASLYAAELPDNVDKLVLLAPANLLTMPPRDGGLFEWLDASLQGEERTAFRAWRDEYLDLWGVTARSTRELEALDARLLPYWERVVGPVPAGAVASGPGVWHARAQFFSLGMRHDWHPFLGRVRADTLIVHASDDLQPLSVAEGYRAAIPGGPPVRTVAGAGHFLHYTHPAEVEQLLRAFLDGP